jgi:hypothetical protein
MPAQSPCSAQSRQCRLEQSAGEPHGAQRVELDGGNVAGVVVKRQHDRLIGNSRARGRRSLRVRHAVDRPIAAPTLPSSASHTADYVVACQASRPARPACGRASRAARRDDQPPARLKIKFQTTFCAHSRPFEYHLIVFRHECSLRHPASLSLFIAALAHTGSSIVCAASDPRLDMSNNGHKRLAVGGKPPSMRFPRRNGGLPPFFARAWERWETLRPFHVCKGP